MSIQRNQSSLKTVLWLFFFLGITLVGLLIAHMMYTSRDPKIRLVDVQKVSLKVVSLPPVKLQKKKIARVQVSFEKYTKQLDWIKAKTGPIWKTKRVLIHPKLFAKVQPFVRLFRELRMQPVCITSKKTSKSLSHVAFFKGSYMLNLSLLIQAQTQPDLAIDALLKTMRWFQQIRQECLLGLVEVWVVNIALRSYLKSVFSIVSQHSVKKTSKKQILLFLYRLATESFNPIVRALRIERNYIRTHMMKASKDKVDAIWIWPWWDKELTQKWFDALSKVILYRASQPYSKTIWNVLPIERALQRHTQRSRFPYIFAQYNAVGFILLSLSSTQAYSKWIVRDHQFRCYIAALYIHIARSNPGLRVSAEMRNPFTDKPFGAIEPTTCSISGKGVGATSAQMDVLETYSLQQAQ